MERFNRYISDVQSDKVVTCQLVKLAIQRHVSDLEKSKTNWPFYFSEAHAQHAITFFSLIKHTSGKLAGKPFNLQDNQAFQVGMLFGWRQKDSDNRRFTQAYIEVARKAGKSQLAAAIELYCGLCEGEESAEIYTAATTRDQADMVFRAVKKMSRYLRQDSKAMKQAINVMAHSVILPLTDSFIQKVSADAGTLDGLNPHCAVIDEYHAHKNDMVKGVMQTGMGSRENPLLLIITTAGFDKSGPCFAVERKNAVSVLKGERVQDNLFGMIFTLDEGDDWTNPNVWIKPNPNLGSTPTVKYLQDQVQDAINKGTSTRVQVLTKNFNMWLDTPKVWIPDELVKSTMKPLNFDRLVGRVCHAGIDLAATSDIAAVGYFFPAQGDQLAVFLVELFLPSDTIERKKDDTNYLQWVEDGFIKTTPGNVTDYARIRESVNAKREIGIKVQSAAYDPWNGYQLATELTGDMLEMKLCRQTYANMSEPLKWIEKAISAGEIEVQENPVLSWMFQNVALDFDPNDNIKLNKAKAGGKIDGVSAFGMCVFAWLTSPAPVTSYLFEDDANLLTF